MRFISILGDSISTFEGYHPAGYAVYYDRDRQAENGLHTVYDTWWAKVNQAMKAYLCVNNSYSGSMVSGGVFPSAVCEERLKLLRTQRDTPDYILVYIGFNDFGHGVRLRTHATGLQRKDALSGFQGAYHYMLKSLKQKYPDSRIVCATLMRTYIKDEEKWIFPESFGGIELEQYNQIIRLSAQKNHCYLADISAGHKRYETLDGSHPTAMGHACIADAWIARLLDLGIMKPSIESCVTIYHQNQNNAAALAMVFDALVNERVMVPYGIDGQLIWMPDSQQKILPVFTSPREKGQFDMEQLRTVFLRDNLELIHSLKLNVMINPFSRDDLRFYMPYDADAIEKHFKPRTGRRL